MPSSSGSRHLHITLAAHKHKVAGDRPLAAPRRPAVMAASRHCLHRPVMFLAGLARHPLVDFGQRSQAGGQSPWSRPIALLWPFPRSGQAKIRLSENCSPILAGISRYSIAGLDACNTKANSFSQCRGKPRYSRITRSVTTSHHMYTARARCHPSLPQNVCRQPSRRANCWSFFYASVV